MSDAPEFRLTDRPVKPPGQVPFYRRFAKQIVFSVIGSMVAGMIINATSLAVGVQYASAIIVRTFGDPFARGKEVAKEVKERVQKTIDHTPGTVPVPINPLHQPPVPVLDLVKHHEEEQRKKYIARADAVGLKHDDDWDLAKFKVEVPKAEDKFKEAEERKPLLAQARELKMLVDEDWDNKMLKAEIMEEKRFQKDDAIYQELLRRHQEALRQRENLIANGPNARCPNRQCGHMFRTKRTKGEYICPRCRGFFPITQAKASYTPPPMPREPFPPQRKPPGFFKRVFG